MRALSRRLLVVLLSLGVFAGFSQAGDYAFKKKKKKYAEPVTSETIDDEGDTDVEPGKKAKKKTQTNPHPFLRSVTNIWHSQILLPCYSHFNDYSCGGIYADTAFHFGSCRTFFSEKCIKGPPPSPVPGFDPSQIQPKPGCPWCR